VSAAPAQAPAAATVATTRVAVIGSGAIGSAVIRALADGALDGVDVVGVVDNRTVVDSPVPQMSMVEAIASSDVIVECAGQVVVAQYAAEILSAGVDLLVTSVGALADPAVADRVLAAGPGRMLCTAGAVGGVDLLAAAAGAAPMRRVAVTTTKRPAALVQPWMDQVAEQRLRSATAPVEVFRGSAREAAKAFPRSLNVAATVALATGDFDAVEVVLVGDPDADLTTHVIEAEGATGEYRFEIRNHPSPANPRTSGIVPFAVLRSLAVLIGRPVRIA
jgi:aspartate dehydrogenase